MAKVRFTNRELIRRFGADPIPVTNEQAAQYMRDKTAVPVTSFDDPPLEDTRPKVEETARHGGMRPLVGWVHDTEKHGGAELSNFTVIGAGRELGFGDYVCTPTTFDKAALVACDFLVISNFFFFKPDQYHSILDLIFEYGKPFVKYEHDHREVIGDEARPELASLLFGHSFLNVFISPMQAENHRRHLGDLVEPFFLLPPAVDTRLFRRLPEVDRDPRKMVNVTGRLRDSKGFHHMLQFIISKQKEFNFEIYTRRPEEVESVFGKLGCVKVYPPVENDYLPKVYSSANFVIHLPRALEACGRTIAEGMLCGCSPITNENVGIRSFKEFHVGDSKRFDGDLFRRKLERGVYDFWRAVDLARRGFYERSSIWRTSRQGRLPYIKSLHRKI